MRLPYNGCCKTFTRRRIPMAQSKDTTNLEGLLFQVHGHVCPMLSMLEWLCYSDPQDCEGLRCYDSLRGFNDGCASTPTRMQRKKADMARGRCVAVREGCLNTSIWARVSASVILPHLRKAFSKRGISCAKASTSPRARCGFGLRTPNFCAIVSSS